MRALVLAPLLMLTACATTASPPLELAGTRWKLASADTGALAKSAAQVVTAEFGAGDVSGHGGCNRYTSTWTLAGNTLTFGPVAATKMFCGDGGSEVERAWFAALAQPVEVTRVDGQLQLTAADGTVLRFAAQP